jgi:2-haloacid dehalogenase
MPALPLIVFDVNETLLDLGTMEPIFQRIFGDKSAMRLWFANLIMYSAALTVARCYVPFTDIGAAVMKMLADTRGIKIDDKDKKELTEKFSTMPPHPEVPAALRKLREAGFRLFTLTDNLLEVQTRQLEHGGIVTASSITNRRPRLMAMSRASLPSSRPSFVLSPATPGTRSAPSPRAGRRR